VRICVPGGSNFQVFDCRWLVSGGLMCVAAGSCLPGSASVLKILAHPVDPRAVHRYQFRRIALEAGPVWRVRAETPPFRAMSLNPRLGASDRQGMRRKF